MDNDGLVLVGVIFYFLGAALAGWLAERGGRSPVVFVLGCLVFPIATLPAIIYLAVVAARRRGGPKALPDRLDALERLARLHAAGALTDHEFRSEKNRLMQR